jgi:hypothetical protein
MADGWQQEELSFQTSHARGEGRTRQGWRRASRVLGGDDRHRQRGYLGVDRCQHAQICAMTGKRADGKDR